MTGKTIGGSYSSGITLTYPGDNPTTITNAGTIDVASGVALYAPGNGAGTNSWTIDNAGYIKTASTYISGTSNIGIQLGSGTAGVTGNLLTNESGGTIAGYYALEVFGDGTVVNYGTVAGGRKGVLLTGSGYVNNGALITGGYGVDIAGDATVVNSGTIYGSFDAGIYSRGAATIVNSGTILSFSEYAINITGGSGSTSYLTNTGTGYIGDGGVLFDYAAILVNDGTIVANGRAIWMGGGGTLTNTGTITTDRGVYLDGGYVNNNGGMIAGVTLGVHMYGIGTVVNTGTISASDGFGYGISFAGGGYVNNNGGLIAGGSDGIYLGAYGGAATVINTGTIDASNNYGLFIAGAAAIVNSGAILSPDSSFTIRVGGTGGSNYLTNTQSGYIGPGGVYLGNVATVVNDGTIVDTNGGGIYLEQGGTLIDSGTISGSSHSIYLAGSGSNLVGLQAGYKLVGDIYGGASSTDTLELLGTAGAPVTVDYNGIVLTNFEDVQFGPNGHATLTVSNTGLLGITISGFDQSSEKIVLTGIGSDGTISGTSANAVTITGSVDSVTLTLDGSDATQFITAPDPVSGTDLTPACYCRGTLILTPDGEVPVEDLKIGDRVMTLSGKEKLIRWIGHRAYDRRFVAGNPSLLPVRIAAGALADGVPARDLLVSPEHSLYIDGVLVAARQLVNGATITQETAVKRVEYFHIELDAHDIIFADGAPAESYVECDNRGKFHNAGEFATLYPEGDHARWQFCAPLLHWDSEEPNAIREALMQRAEALGYRLGLDPDLHLVVDGAVVRPDSVDGRAYYFIIPAGSTAALLASRSTVPAEIRADARDLRRLGVPVERLVLRDADLRIEAAHSHAGLRAGFHDDEPSHRWTGGFAPLPETWLHAFSGAFTLEVHLIAAELPYRLAPPARAAA